MESAMAHVDNTPPGIYPNTSPSWYLSCQGDTSALKTPGRQNAFQAVLIVLEVAASFSAVLTV